MVHTHFFKEKITIWFIASIYIARTSREYDRTAGYLFDILLSWFVKYHASTVI